MVHMFRPEGARGLLVNIETLQTAVRNSVLLISRDSSNDVPRTPWR
jgi:hypothetical protein